MDEVRLHIAGINGNPAINISVTTSAGSDGATVIFIDTDPDEPDFLRIILNDGDVFEGRPYVPDPTD